MEIQDSIIKTLEKFSKPMKAGEIAENTGLDKNEIDKSIKKLIKEGKLFSPSRCYYDIKK